MTRTPLPRPVVQGYLVVCDACRTTAPVDRAGDLPAGWEDVYIEGYVGAFQACSGECAEELRRKKS